MGAIAAVRPLGLADRHPRVSHRWDVLCPIDAEWRKVSYQVFDLPDNPAAFDVRLSTLNTLFGAESKGGKPSNATIKPEWLVVINQFKVSRHADLMNEFHHDPSGKLSLNQFLEIHTSY